MNGLAVNQQRVTHQLGRRRKPKMDVATGGGVVRTNGAEDVDGDLDGTQDRVFAERRSSEGEEVRNGVGTERVGVRDETN